MEDPAVDAVGVRLFDDPAKEAQLRREGFATATVFPPDAVAELLDSLRAVYPEGRTGITYALVEADREFWRAARPIVRPYLEQYLEPMFPRHRVGFSIVVVKNPGPGSAMGAHEDGSKVASEHGRSVAAWIPLVDCLPESRNGGIAVIPRSHLMVDTVAGTNVTEWFGPYRDYLTDHLVPAPVRAGEAVLWDQRILHGSPANESDEPRFVIVSVLIPRHADLVHVEATGRTGRRSYVVDDDFFLSHSPVDVRDVMPDYPERERFEERVPLVSAQQVADLCGTSDVPVATVARPQDDWTTSSGAAQEIGSAPAPQAAADHEDPFGDVERWASQVLEDSRVLLARRGRLSGVRVGEYATERTSGAIGYLELARNGIVTPDARRELPATSALLDAAGFSTATFIGIAPWSAVAPARAAGHEELHLPLTMPWGSAGVATARGVVPYEFGRPVIVDAAAMRQVFNDSAEEIRVLVLTRPLLGGRAPESVHASERAGAVARTMSDAVRAIVRRTGAGDRPRRSARRNRRR